MYASKDISARCPCCGGVVREWDFDGDCRGNPPSSGLECRSCTATWNSLSEIIRVAKKRSRGKCPVCGYRFTLTSDGRMSLHALWTGGGRRQCGGSRMLPAAPGAIAETGKVRP